MNIVFMGSPDFAVPTLEALLKSEHKVLAVFSQPPRSAGRGQKLALTPVHATAEAANIPVFTPEKLKGEALENLQNLKPDLICVVAYGLILPQAVLDIAPCLNLHPSALPKWRGAAPMNYPILNGETETDICIMQMEKGLDSGPVYLRKSYSIGENETAGELINRFKGEGANHMLEVINSWTEYKEKAVEQVGETCYAHKFKTEDLPSLRAITWAKSANEIHSQIRGLSPWPAANFKHKGEDIKVLESTLSKGEPNGTAGAILRIDEQGIHVATSQGTICLKKLQRAGKNVLPAAEFVKGYSLHIGEILE